MFERFGVRTFWMTALALAMLVSLKPAPVRAQAQSTHEGTLTIVWGDPQFRQTAGVIRYFLTSPDGQSQEMQVSQEPNEVLQYNGHRVLVTGQMASGLQAAAAVGASSTLIATSIVDDPRVPNQAAFANPGVSADPTSGTKKVIFVLLKYAGDAQEPHPANFFLDLTNPDPSTNGSIPATINQFFRKVSNNTFSWQADVAGSAYLTLPQPKSYYANCNFSISCLNFTRFNTDAVALAKANAVNFALYDNVNFVINNDLDCCAWGGGINIDGKILGATWEPPWGQKTSVYSHEMGHSLGLPHSGWLYEDYDSPWDTMSAIRTETSVSCGTYVSANSSNATAGLSCDRPGNGYIAGHRDFLGWIPGANQVSVSSPYPTTNVALEGNSVPLSTGVKLIKICLPGIPCTGTGSSTRYFTVEARVKDGGTTTQFDNAVPGNGVIIHDFWFGRPPIPGSVATGCYFNNQSGFAVPVDATPGDFNSSSCTGTGLQNAQFTAGMTYTNSTYGFKVIVQNRVGNVFNVTVQSTVGTQINIDTPSNGSTVTVPFSVSGWAINQSASSGTGVDMIHVYANKSGGSSTFLGQATYGNPRSDVGAIFGSQFTNSGYSLNATAPLTPGAYTIVVYARNAATGLMDTFATVGVNVAAPTSQPFIAVDTPTNNQLLTSAFEVGGWALDKGAPTGTGVDAVQCWIVPSGAAPVFIGNASYGAARSDVAAAFGSQFTNVGWHFTVTGLGPGTFTLEMRARSTITGTFSIIKQVPFTVNATALMSVDAPSPEAAFPNPTFGVAGWSIDRTVESTAIPGTGVDQLHVYAYPNPGSGTPPIFLGFATMGISRPDVAAAYGSRYGNSGYVINIDRAALGLTPGVYSIVVHSHSAVSGTFNNQALVRVTLQ